MNISEEEKIELIMGDFIASVMFYNPSPETFIRLSRSLARFINAFVHEKTTIRKAYGSFINDAKGITSLSESEILEGISGATLEAIKKNPEAFKSDGGV